MLGVSAKTSDEQHQTAQPFICPERATYHSPGQGQASEARRAAALGLVCQEPIGRAVRSASNRHIVEAGIKPRLDFVLGKVPKFIHAFRSDTRLGKRLPRAASAWGRNLPWAMVCSPFRAEGLENQASQHYREPAHQWWHLHNAAQGRGIRGCKTSSVFTLS